VPLPTRVIASFCAELIMTLSPWMNTNDRALHAASRLIYAKNRLLNPAKQAVHTFMTRYDGFFT
jgi:hypothetical protein